MDKNFPLDVVNISYHELRVIYRRLCKTYSELLKENHTLKMIADDYKLANAELVQECEDLQKENKQLKEWQEANKATGICETCTHKTLLENDELRYRIRELNKLNKKYKKALDEIEKLTDIREVHGLTDTEYVENFKLHQKRILDIINKVKED